MLKLQRFDIFGHSTLFTDLPLALNAKKAMCQLGYSNDDVKIDFCIFVTAMTTPFR